VAYSGLDQAHQFVKSWQAIIEDDFALAIHRHEAEEPDRAPNGCSHGVLDLANTIPGQTDPYRSDARGLDVLIRYDDAPCGPPALTRKRPEE
jgi:hypothetical protein